MAENNSGDTIWIAGSTEQIEVQLPPVRDDGQRIVVRATGDIPILVRSGFASRIIWPQEEIASDDLDDRRAR